MPENLTLQDGQIIRIENGSAIIASTYNKTDIPDFLQMEEIETAQGTKPPGITQPQVQNPNNETTDKHKSEF